MQTALVKPAAVKTEGRNDQLQLIHSAREHVEAAQALGIGVLEALAAGGAPAHLAQRVATAVALARHAAAAADASLLRCSVAAPAAAGGAGPESTALQQIPHLLTAERLERQGDAGKHGDAARQAAHALAAFDAGLEPLRAALDPCRNPVPPCRRPPKRQHAEGPGAASGSGLGSGSQAAALEALAARVAAATGFPVVLTRGHSGSGGTGKTSASSAPCAAAEATELRMALPGVLTAAVALTGAGQLAAQRVAVFGADEAPPSGPKDAWAASEGVVFRRLSDVATRALAHFTARAERAAAGSGADADGDAAGGAAAAALEDLLLWLSSYRDLFTRPCAATGCLLGADPALQLLLPPVVRPFRHVPHLRLLAAAQGSETLPAYHLRAAPASVI